MHPLLPQVCAVGAAIAVLVQCRRWCIFQTERSENDGSECICTPYLPLLVLVVVDPNYHQASCHCYTGEDFRCL